MRVLLTLLLQLMMLMMIMVEVMWYRAHHVVVVVVVVALITVVEVVLQFALVHAATARVNRFESRPFRNNAHFSYYSLTTKREKYPINQFQNGCVDIKRSFIFQVLK